MPNLTDPICRLPWPEDLRSRAERALAEARRLADELRDSCRAVRSTTSRARALTGHGRHGEQAADPAGGGALPL
jgi:hypothetical protein